MLRLRGLFVVYRIHLHEMLDCSTRLRVRRGTRLCGRRCPVFILMLRQWLLAADLPVVPSRAGETHVPHRVHIRGHVELKRYGPTPGCPGCHSFQIGGRPINHSEACRERIENLMRQDAASSKERVDAADTKRMAGGAVVVAGSTSSPATLVRVSGVTPSGRLRMVWLLLARQLLCRWTEWLRRLTLVVLQQVVW